MTFRRKGSASSEWLLLLALGALSCEAPPQHEHAAPTDGARRTAVPERVNDAASGGRGATPGPEPTRTPPPGVSQPTPTGRSADADSFEPTSPSQVRIAVIGDYGWAGPAEQQVAELVDSFRVDFVITTGDNNYPVGAAETIDDNIGQYFSELIHPYLGSYPSSATENRFFPVLGNHDWYTEDAAPYLAYFTLPGNERYYDIVRGDVHFFAIDSDEREPDGISADSVQGQWLKRGLESSTAAFKLVAMHHPPFSSGPHGNSPLLQWPYAAWGADVVLAGHDHGYERLEVDGIPYIVSGLGGASLYSYGEPVEPSLVRYSEHYGAALIEADSRELKLSFFDVDGRLIDSTAIAAR